MSVVAFLSPFNRGQVLKVREQRGGQKSSRRVYLCDKSLPFVRREVPRFQKALTCRVSRALSCAPSRPWFAGKYGWRLGFSLGKVNKTHRVSNRDGSCFGQSQISERPVRASSSFAKEKEKRRGWEREGGRGREREGEIRDTYFASNYNVTSRREEGAQRCGPTIYRGRHIAEIFSHRIWLLWKDESGGGGELLREIRLWAKAQRGASRERVSLSIFLSFFVSIRKKSRSLTLVKGEMRVCRALGKNEWKILSRTQWPRIQGGISLAS